MLVPSLSSICLQILGDLPDPLEVNLGFRLHYRSEITPPSSFSLHPNLWICLVQLYDNLPACLRSYNIPLYHPHLPLLQRVHSTSLFSLLTILDLPACPDLTDNSISNLKFLHSLVAFDASETTLSSYAVKVLARTLVYTQYDTTRRGPWFLRILRIRNCKNIDNDVYDHISLFPLLSVVDLRGTRCTRNPSSIFRPASTPNSVLYHPSPLPAALSFLQSTSPLHSSQNLFSLHISTLRPPLPRRQSTIAPQNSFVVIPSKNAPSSRLITGDAETLTIHRRIHSKWLFATSPPVCHRTVLRTPTNTNRDSTTTYHSVDCFCGGAYGTQVQEEEDSEDESEEVYEGAPDCSSEDDSDGSSSSSPSLVDASVPQCIPARSISITAAPPVVNALSVTPSTPTTTTQRLSLSDLTPQVPHYNSVSTPASFYYHDVYKEHLSRGARRAYSADAYYKRARPKMKHQRHKYDQFLMLYRDPPTWNILETATSSAASNIGVSGNTMDRKQTGEGAKKRDEKKQAALEALQIAATRRVPMPSQADTISYFPTPTPSKNPFRRNISETKQNDRLRGLSQQSRLQDTSSQSSAKPLKPISAVKVPLLPTGLWHQPPSSTAPIPTTTQMKIRPEMNEVGACGSTAPATLVAAKLKPREKTNVGTLKRSTSMGDIKHSNNKSRFSDRVNLEDHSEVRSWKVDAKRQRRSFDWSGWAAHAR